MRVTYPQWMNYDNNRSGGGVMNGGVRQGKGKGNWSHHYQNHHYNYNNGYPSYHNHNQMMRMTMSTGSTMTSRVQRKVLRIPSKRHPGKALPGKLHSATRIGGKVLPGKRLRPQQSTHCDNSNDSGLGYDQYADTPYANIKQIPSARLPSSCHTTDSTTICTSRLAADGNVQNDPYGDGEASTSAAAMNAMLIDKNETPSTYSFNQIDSKMNDMDEIKRQKFDHKIDIDDTCSNDAFVFNSSPKGKSLKSNLKTATAPSNASKISTMVRGSTRPAIRRTAIGSQILNAPNNNMGVIGTVTLQSQIGAISQNGKYQLQILTQPEQQHRARYQTEGSRGAVKDRSGNGFPVVKLTAYDKPATLQIFIGTDVGRVAPHMFYQACKVSGKNSTPCNEKKVEGTIVIEIDLKPESDMTATCDCVGILKERNVDVEHRFPDQTAGPRSKKKSTRCRMVFRTQITHDDGTVETLQVCSQQIICTQPPGVPEICKKSLVSCPANGGLELFIIGKNFLKDTRVIFQARRLLPPASETFDTIWEESVFPDKEFLQQTHLICTVPPYADPDIIEPVTVQMLVTSSNKFSEPHNFVYTPKSAFGAGALAMASTLASLQHAHSKSIQDMGYGNEESRSMSPTPSPVLKNASPTCPTLMLWANHLKETSNKIDAGIMPPPATTLPLNIRRTSLTGLLCGSNDQTSPPLLKSEILDENSQNSILSTGADSLHDTIDYVSENSMDASNPATLMNQTPMDLIATANGFSQPPPLLNMQSTSPINVVDLRVKQEDSMATQMQDLVHPALGEPPKLISGVPDVSLMTPFGRSKLNDLKVQVNDVPIFNAPTSTDVMLNNNLGTMNHVVSVVSPLTTNQQMQQTIEQSTVFAQQGLMTEAGTANSLNHMLSFPSSTQAISPNILGTSPTNQSPLATDVMLNSQAIASINTSPTAMLTVEPVVNNSSIESDIIMNSTISPTMMCNNTSADAANLIPNNVTIGDAPMLSAQAQPASEALLNNFIQPMSIKQSDAVVKNMILNAAAEILSSEPNSITSETANNALLSMNTEQAANTTNSSPPSITNILTHSDSTSSVVVLAGSNKLIQNVVAAAAAQNASDIIQNQVVNADPLQISANPQIVNVQPTTTAASAAAANLSLAQQSLLNNIQQEICALSTETIVGNEIGTKSRKIPESMSTDPIVSETIVPNVTNGVTATTTNPPQTGTMMPDLTTMSDHDLISYINPNCFDQVQL